MLLILAFVCLAGALFIAGKTVTDPRRERQESLRRARGSSGSELEGEKLGLDSLTTRYTPGLAAFASRIDPRATEARVAHRLVSAGLARRFSPAEFLALKVVLGVVGALGGALLGILAASGTATIVLGIGLAAVGFWLPDAVASQRTRVRRETIRRELPDALDILAISVEAGLGFEAALAKLSEYMEGPLVEEFLLVLAELRIGESRSNALRKMADRVEIAELTSVVTSLIQAEHLGSPLGDMLRVQADESRHRRQVAAEEQAMKAPVKMLLPTAVFIFPALFVVVLAPAMIRVFDALGT